MKLKKLLRRLRLLRTLYYKLQLKKDIKNIPPKVYNDTKNELIKLKDAYKGNRCFIIGNGPSLTAADLDHLKNEYTFASNRIFKIYGETEWRPTFYACQDGTVLESIQEELPSTIRQSELAFIAISQYKKCKNITKEMPNILWIPLRYVPPKKNIYKFSENIEKEVIEGLTVTYSCMQLAVYMGFTKIYLLGVDHNYAVEFDADGNIVNENKETKNYFGGDENQNVATTPPQVIEMSRAFISANKFSKLNGFTIYNATRGGKLEVFERVAFDEIS